jgi:periplasmic divalent cation tolerance protein
MTPYIQIATTTATKEEAEQIAAVLIEQRLVACAQVTGPVASVYHWQNKVETGTEWLCMLKTREVLFERVTTAIRDVHSYQCPEIVAIPIVAASPDYLAWLERELTG